MGFSPLSRKSARIFSHLPSTSPDTTQMDSRTSSWMSGSCSPSMLMVPLVWKPPMMTAMFSARKHLARSRARGNWFVCTPTKHTKSLVPGSRLHLMIVLIGIFFCGFVEGRDFDWQLAKNSALLYVLSQTMEYVESIARQNTFPESNDVAIVVIFRRLDQNDMKFLDSLRRSLTAHPCKSMQHPL